MTKTTDAKARKRAKPPRASDYTRAFRKDWQRLTHSGRYDMRRLKEAMLPLIAADAPLGPNGWTTRSRASGRTTANATSVATSC
ncbi:hypothetical protein [Ottowia beijingensis]|uniref:hypothetical protein n=1 Tax=Ottowia beijingensis TaxID=1207057 RepID=UPI0027D9E491|nr:hypothetical protein [Ottowia beijingensis]